MRYKKFDLVFNNIRYLLAIPENPRTYRSRSFRMLISQHGTRQTENKRGGDEYVQYPLDHDDPYWYDLIVVAPHFPAASTTTAAPNGENFNWFSGSGLTWIHDLIHTELPNVFAEPILLRELGVNLLSVDTSKVYFFGQSLGGMALHTYIMKFKGEDIYRAAAGGGQIFEREEAPSFRNMSNSDYLDRLDAFISTNVASILGTNEAVHRIESVRSWICRELSKRVSQSNVDLVSPIPPVSLEHPESKLTCDLFNPPVIIERNPKLSSMGYRFFWNAGFGHWGEAAYTKARTFLFEDRIIKPITFRLFFTEFKVILTRFFGVRLDTRIKLKEQLEEQLNMKDFLPEPPEPPRP